MMKKLKTSLLWIVITLLGVISFAILAFSRGESISAAWLIIAAVACYSISYRFYSLFIAKRIFALDDRRLTPAERHHDGLDYVPTNKWVLFGHHFAAIAGAGPLVGPILAAQMGYLPGTLWILIGVMLAGAVQDFLVLFISTRRDGRSLGEIARQELGSLAGIITMVGILVVMIIILSALALIVIKALSNSPWGLFTLAATIPIALFMGIYMRFIRPAKIAEISLIGFVLIVLAIIGGAHIAQHPFWGSFFTVKGTTLTLCLMIYAFIASSLPVWLLLAPRDYLSTFLKIGVILGLAVGILFVMPDLKMPAVTRFIDGSGPVFSGGLFPFLFITIACGAVSGFHALVASGTTPKMIERESHIRFIGYGGMLMESFVAIMALICASILEPGIYFAINAPTALIGNSAESAANVITQWGFNVTPDSLTLLASQIGENTILSRAGGAPTFAVGMAHIVSNLFNTPAMMAFWYHFAILFEALFILTAVDAGTRACRFMIQDLAGTVFPSLANSRSLIGNLSGTFLAVAGWGFFVYQGVTDPLGGINTLWPLFGIGNQILASIALILGTTILFKMKKQRYAWVTILPTIWLLITSMAAGWQKIFHSNPAIGFIAMAKKFSIGLEQNQLIAPATSLQEMQAIIFNNYIDAGLCLFFMLVTLIILIVSGVTIYRALLNPQAVNCETPAILRQEGKVHG